MADSMESMLADGDMIAKIEMLRAKDATIVDKIKAFLDKLVRQIKKAYRGLKPDSAEGRYVAETLKAAEKLRDLWSEAVAEAGKARAETVSRMNFEKMHDTDSQTSGDVRESARESIASDDVKIIQSIATSHPKGYSINDFTAEEVRKAEPWARKFYAELGTKSPFFRRWFGDWRSHEKKGITIVSRREDAVLKNGRTVNADSEKIISWNSHDVIGETKNHAVKDKVSIEAIGQLEEIVQRAILLDTYVSLPDSKSKMPQTAFMHAFYTIYENSNGRYLLKLFVEEALSGNEKVVFNRAYELKDIEKVANLPIGVSEDYASPSYGKFATDYSIADLHALVKRYDKSFSPKPVSPVLLNEDGTPKVVYHGTPHTDFTEFDKRRIASTTDHGLYGRGFYFSSSKRQAEQYAEGGGRVIEAYLSIKNPLMLKGMSIPELVELLDIDESILTMDGSIPRPLASYAGTFTSHVKYAGYDGIIVDHGSVDEIVVFEQGEIKSATDNIGTFDGTNPDIRYSDRDQASSVSNRSLLANALESTAQNDIERHKLEEYKANIGRMDAEQEKLTKIRAEIKELSFAKGKRNTEKIKALREEAAKTEKRINTYDKRLLGMESTTALKRVLEREKRKAYERADKQGKEALKKYREKAANQQRNIIAKNAESRKRATEGRHRTEMQNKIKKSKF